MAHTILIVEDEESTRRVLGEKLEHEGFKVVQAINGIEGLEKMRAQKPDLALVDIIMPKMDGMSFIKHAHEEEVLRQVPIILLTNLSDAEHVTQAMSEGVFDYLIKTEWSLEDLIHLIHQKLGD